MFRNADAVGLGTEAAPAQDVFKAVAVVTRRFALPQPENVGETECDRDERDAEGSRQRRFYDDNEEEEQRDARTHSPDKPPEKPPFQTPSAAFRVGRGVRVAEA